MMNPIATDAAAVRPVRWRLWVVGVLCCLSGAAMAAIPVAGPESIQVVQGGTATTLVGGASSLLANDTGADGHPLTAELYSGPTHGSLTMYRDGTFRYTHTDCNTGDRRGCRPSARHMPIPTPMSVPTKPSVRAPARTGVRSRWRGICRNPMPARPGQSRRAGDHRGLENRFPAPRSSGRP